MNETMVEASPSTAKVIPLAGRHRARKRQGSERDRALAAHVFEMLELERQVQAGTLSNVEIITQDVLLRMKLRKIAADMGALPDARYRPARTLEERRDRALADYAQEEIVFEARIDRGDFTEAEIAREATKLRTRLFQLASDFGL